MDTSTTTKRTFLSLLSANSIRNLSVGCRRSFCVILLLGLAACGGGGGGSQSTETTPPPVIANPDTFYLADQDTDGVDELYQVDSTNPGVSRKLNSVLVSGGNVVRFKVSPDGSRVVYAADQEEDNRFELFVVETDNPGVSAKVHPDMVADGELPLNGGFSLSADGRYVYYVADQDTQFLQELYRADLDAPGTAIRLSSNDVSGGGVDRFVVSPDDDAVVYFAPENGAQSSQLYLAQISNPGVTTVVNPPLDTTRFVSFGFFEFRPDGLAIIYQADQEQDDRRELFQVFVNATGVSEKLNGPLTAGGTVDEFRLGSDSDRIFYIADQDIDGTRELYQVFLNNPGQSSRLNGNLQTDGFLSLDFSVTSDNRWATYEADQDTDGVFELYAALTSSPGASVKLNEALSLPGGEFGHVFEHVLAPDDETIIFLADKDTADVRELYTASFSNPGINTKLSGPLPPGYSIEKGFQLSPDGQRVVYRVSSNSGAAELYQVRLDTPGVARRVNGPLVSDGDVKPTTARTLSLL